MSISLPFRRVAILNSCATKTSKCAHVNMQPSHSGEMSGDETTFDGEGLNTVGHIIITYVFIIMCLTG